MLRLSAASLILLMTLRVPTPASGVSLGATKINAYPNSGTITFSDWQFPDTLNPLQTSSDVSMQVSRLLFAGLVTMDAKGRLVPDLLANIPTISNREIRDQGRTIVLKLKPHQYWSSGVEITNQDIRFDWRAYMNRAAWQVHMECL